MDLTEYKYGTIKYYSSIPNRNLYSVTGYYKVLKDVMGGNYGTNKIYHVILGGGIELKIILHGDNSANVENIDNINETKEN